MKFVILLITNLLCIQARTIITYPPDIEHFFLSFVHTIVNHVFLPHSARDQDELCRSFLTAKIFKPRRGQQVENLQYESKPRYALELEKREFRVGSTTYSLNTLPCQFSTGQIHYLVRGTMYATYFLFRRKTDPYGADETNLIGYVDPGLDKKQVVSEQVQDIFEECCMIGLNNRLTAVEIHEKFRQLFPAQRFRLCSLVYDSVVTSDSLTYLVQDVPTQPESKMFSINDTDIGIPTIMCTVSSVLRNMGRRTIHLVLDVKDPHNIFVAFSDSSQGKQTLHCEKYILAVHIFMEN